MRSVLGPEVGARLKPIWGLDPEGEIQGTWRDVGVPRVWCMMGKLSCPFPASRSGEGTTNSARTQVTLHCAGSTRSTSLYVSFFGVFHFARTCRGFAVSLMIFWHRSSRN